MCIAAVHSRIFDQLPPNPPRNGHHVRLYSPIVMSHEKALMVPFRKYVLMQSPRQYR